MADPGMSSSLQDYLASRYPAAQPTAAPAGMVAPPSTGTGNLVTSALASGVLGAGSQIASGVEGGAKLLGADSVAQAAAGEATRARAAAATYQRPDLENGSLLDPRVLGYKVLQGLPGAVPAIGGMIAGGPVGAAIGAFPGTFGGNVQANEDYTHAPITRGAAAKAALIGVPEAAVAGLPLGKAEALMGGEGSIAGVAATQAAVAAGQTALGGMMGDPNRSLADRAQDMLSAALTGGATGALFGAGAHALSKVPVTEVTNDQMTRSMDADLGQTAPPPAPDTTQKLLPPPVKTDQLETLALPAPTPPEPRMPAPPDVVGAPPPADIPSRQFAHLSDEDLFGRAKALVDQGATPESSEALQRVAEEMKTRDQANEAAKAQPPEEQPPADPREVVTPSERQARMDAEQAASDQRIKDYWEGTAYPPAEAAAEPNRPPIEAIDEKHQPLWTKLEDAREGVTDPDTVKAIDDAQTSLAAPSAGEPQKAAAVLTKAKQMAETEKAAAVPDEPAAAPPADEAPKGDQFGETKAAVIEAQKSLNTMKKMDAAPADAEPKSKTITNNLWQKGLADQQAKLTQIASELKKTGNPENLVGLPADHFQNDDFWTSNDKFNQRAQLALDAHADHEENVLGSLREAPMMRARVPSTLDAAPPAGHPVNAGLHQIISEGGTGQDALAHIASNGSSGFNKVAARLALKAGVDPKLSYGSPTPAALKNMPFLKRGETPSAHYDVVNDRINLHSNSSLEQDVLHESFHAATMKALNANTPAARELGQMYQDVKLRSPGNDAYGLRNVHEFVAEAFSNPDFQAHLDSLSASPVVNNGKIASMWQSFKNVVGKILGARPGHQTMMDEVMDAGQRLMDENKTAPATRAPASTPQDTDARMQPLMARINDSYEKVKDTAEATVTDLAPKARGAWLGFRDSLGISRWYEKYAPSMTNHTQALTDRSLLTEANNKSSRVAIQKLGALPEESRKTLQEMAKGTMMGLDARRPLTAADLKGKSNPGELVKEHNRLNGMWRRADAATKDAYETTISAQRAHVQQIVTTALHNILKGDYATKVPLPEGWDPNEAYRFKPDLHDDPGKNEQYWTDTYKDLSQLAQNHVDAVERQKVLITPPAKGTGRAVQDAYKAKVAGLDKSVEPLRSLIADHAARMDELDRVPNFPMGREGGHFVAGKLAENANIEKFQEMLNAKGFGHLTIDRNLENPSIYARVDKPSQRASLRSVFEDAHAQGILEEGSVSDGSIGEMASGVTPHWQERAMEIMRSSMRGLGDGADDATKGLLAQRAEEMQREFLNALPPSSINRIMARRDGVQGFSEDMMQNVRQRMNSTSRAIANLASQPRIAESVVGMRKDIQALNRTDATVNQKDATTQAVAELIKREAGRTAAQPSAPVQALKEIGHVMEVGANPAYAMMLLGQNMTLGLPRLGGAMGFMNASAAMAKNTAKSFAAMKAVAGGSEGLKFGMREADLRAAGMNEKDIAFFTHQDAMGTFAHSAMTSAMQSEHGDPSSSFGKTRAWASAMGLYSEMQPRMLMALAARDLFEKKGASNRAGETMHDFVHRMVEDSQLNWDPTFNARQTTKQGSFGAMSPLLNQFMGYSTRMTEMLVREVANSFGKGTVEEQAEGRKFLLGHLAVMTTLAGSLGTPMVAVLASVYDRLADWATNKDDHDITASYRNYLAQTFGKETGEVLARGLPRAFGVDLSHWGDERIAPGSTALLMLTEKRKLEDAEKDWLKAEAGSAAGLVGNFAFAARDLANGDYLRGLQKMVPELFRGPVEAAQLAQYGYRDKAGQKLPITATAKDIMMTAMGLDPQQEAEYSEMKKTVSGETTLAQLRSQNITQHMSQALMRGDQADFGRWVQQSSEFQKDHPGQTPPIADLSRYMQQHVKNAAYASATGLPVTPKNLTARGMVSYGDLQRQ